jgi:hypothetical protein
VLRNWLALPLLAAFTTFAPLSTAGPIVTPVGPASTSSIIFAEQYNLISWTLPISYHNVAIAASLTSLEAGMTGTAYLMTQVGIGTTAASELAVTPFTFAQVGAYSDISYVSLFSGLLLGPGAYYVVFSSAEGDLCCGITLEASSFTTEPACWRLASPADPLPARVKGGGAV